MPMFPKLPKRIETERTFKIIVNSNRIIITKYYEDCYVNVNSYRVSDYIFTFLLQGSTVSDVPESPASFLICLGPLLSKIRAA